MFERPITEHARAAADRLAVLEGPVGFTYGLMAEDIARCSAWLASLRLAPGSRVILQTSALYLQWVLFFAVEAQGLVSISVYPVAAPTAEDLAFLRADLVLSMFPGDPRHPTPHEHLGPGWLEAIRRAWPAEFAPRRRRPEDPICIVLSSGTTGAAKKVMLDRAMLDRRLSRDYGLITPESRGMSLVPAGSIAGLLPALRTFNEGATLCGALAGVTCGQALTSMRIDLLSATPRHLEDILADLPTEFTPPVPFTVLVVGGSMSPFLVAQLRQRLTSDLTMTYGSTELGAVAQGRVESLGSSAFSGYVEPWQEVSIIDDDGRPLGPGAIGEIRVRGEDVVGGYLEDDEATARGWRDGWFHPGDLGSVDEQGRLRVLGRTDDLINVAGYKFLPSPIEEALHSHGIVDDVAVFEAPDPASGRAIVWIAYVAAEAVDGQALSRAAALDMPTRSVRVAAIPRNALGKIERHALRAQAEAGLLPG